MSDNDDHSPNEDDSASPSGKGRLGRRAGLTAIVVLAVVDASVFAAVGLRTIHREKEFASLGGSASPATSTAPMPQPTPTISVQPTAQTLRACAQPTLIGTVSVDEVAARVAPDLASSVVQTFERTNALDSPQVFDLIREVRGGGRTWYKARLPIRPNGTTGYIPAKAITVTYTTLHLRVDRANFTLTLFNGCQKIRTFPVGIGTGATPTPVGAFYLTGLFKPPDTSTIYGVSIYTLSGFSEVLTDWRLGGIIGLHGTNDPSSIGRNVSHGCIRMLNRDILALEKLLPLGTPIVIR